MRRPATWAVLLLAIASACAASAVTSASGQTRSGVPTLTYISRLGWSMRFPRAMHVEHSAKGGISFAVDEATVANFPVRHGVREQRTRNSRRIFEVPPRSRSGPFPIDGIAVRVLWFQSLGPIPARGAANPPLRLSDFRRAPSRWYRGSLPRPLQHKLELNERRYYVQVWIGPKASAHQRSVLTRVVASISAR